MKRNSRRASVWISALLIIGLFCSGIADVPGIAGRTAVNAASPKNVGAWVETVRGVPRIRVDGRVISPMAYTGYQTNFNEWLGDQLHIRRLAAAGIHVYYLEVRLPRAPRRLSFRYKSTWQKQVDYGMQKVLAADPEALFILRTMIVPTSEFSEMYPDEMMRFDDGSTGPYTNLDATLEYPNMARNSMASEVWRDQTVQDLRDLVDYVNHHPQSNRVIGYFILAGTAGEWTHWADFDHNTKLFDYSDPMRLAFREWLRKHYHDDVSSLRQAWNDPDVDFQTVAIPTQGERRDYAFFNLRSPAVNQPTIDFTHCLGDVMIDNAELFGQTVKDTSERQVLTGCFWGYTSGGDPVFGKSLNERLLQSTAIDFWAAPPHYMNRGLGDHALIHGASASLRLNNKIWMSEEDLRTHLASEWQRKNVDAPATAEGSVALLTREFGNMISNSVYGYWYEMENGWYKSPEILSFLARSQRIGEWSMGLNRRSNSEIAVVIDDLSQMYSDENIRGVLLREQRIGELCRIGAMPDFYYLSDLASIPKKQYKMIVFLNTLALDEQTRSQIDKLKNGRRTLVWIYGSGAINTDRHDSLFNIRDMENLTGFRHDYRSGDALSMATVIQNDDYLEGLEAGSVFGDRLRDVTSGIAGGPITGRTVPDVPLRFSVAASDSKAVVLGTYTNSTETAFAVKNLRSWTSVFIGSDYPSAQVYRALARQAGVHLYTDNPEDIVYHNGNFLTVHVRDGGPRTIRLPKKTGVFDLFTREAISRKTDQFTINFEAQTTRMFYTGNLNKIPADIRSNQPVPVREIVVSDVDGSARTAEGGSLQMGAIVYPGTADHYQVTWSVQNGTGEATISDNGLLTAVKAGTVTVTALDTVSGVSGSIVVSIGEGHRVLELPMDEGSGTTAADISGFGNDADVREGVTWVEGKVGGGLRFNGSYGFADIGNRSSLNAPNQITVSLWAKRTGSGTGVTPGILSKRDNGWGLIWHTGNTLSTRIYQSDGKAINAGVIDTMALDTWRYITLVANGTTVDTYVDGVRRVSLPYDGTIRTGSSLLLLGMQSSQFFEGVIDEVRIDNTAWTVEQITAEYRRGIRSYTLTLEGDCLTADPPAGLVQENTPVRINAAPPSGQRVATFTVNGIDRKAEMVSGVFTFLMNGNTTVAATCEPDPDQPPTGEAGMLVYLPMSEGAGTKTTDASANGHDGTLQPGAAWTEGRTGSAVSLDGKTGYITCGNKSTLDTPQLMTAELWVKRTGASNYATPGLISKRDGGWGAIWQVGNDSATINARIVQSNGVQVNSGNLANVLTLDVWRHIALVADGTKVTIYVDGVVKSVMGYDGTIRTGTSEFMIGRQAGQTFNGVVDGVRLYSRALSAEEVAGHYQSGS